jgi:hypothetical protein
MENSEKNYSRKTVVQASHLKRQIKSLEASEKISTQYSAWISKLFIHWLPTAWSKERLSTSPVC